MIGFDFLKLTLLPLPPWLKRGMLGTVPKLVTIFVSGCFLFVCLFVCLILSLFVCLFLEGSTFWVQSAPTFWGEKVSFDVGLIQVFDWAQVVYIVPPYHCFVVLSFLHSILPSFHRYVVPSFPRSVLPSFPRSLVLNYNII